MKTTMKAAWGARLNEPITKHGNSTQIVLEQISAGIILEEAILEMMGWEEATKIEIQVSEDSIVLVRRLRDSTTDAAASQRNSWVPQSAPD